MVVSGLVESHTHNALTLSFTHLKSFSGARFVFFPVLAPIHNATVFLLFSRRPEISLKRSNICKEVVKETYGDVKLRELVRELGFFYPIFCFTNL